jgi:hypothetical protein
MDDNKLKKLKVLGYQVNKACGLCQHGQFKPGSDFGTCSVVTYTHLKHTGEDRQMSINRYGVCPNFELEEQKGARLHGFKQLIPV